MDNLILSCNVVLPIFIAIVLGYFLKCIGMLPTSLQNPLNALCFKVFLPIYLFENMYTTDLSAAFDPQLTAFALGGLMALWIVLMLLIPRIEPENARRGVMIQGMFRCNFAVFGLPVALALCGAERMGPSALLVGLVVPMVNVLSVITLETFRGGRPNAALMLRGIATNPLIIGSVAGAVANIAGLKLPDGVLRSVSSLGAVATPLSLVALGASFSFGSVREHARQLAIVVASKLAFNAMVMVPLAVLLGFRQECLVPLMIIFGAPTAVSSYPMAQQMGGDGHLAASVVVFTSAFAVVTIFLWIFLLKTLALI